MKKKILSKAKPQKPQKKEPAPKPKPTAPPPDGVYVAIRKLVDTTNHLQARAAEVENALDELRELEQGRAVAKLLSALRNSPDGDLLRCDPVAPGEAKSIIGALVEAFGITPLHEIGERLPVKRGEIPDSLELDRAIGEEDGKCIAAEVVSSGWKRKEQILLKPMVRPVFNKTA